MLKPLLITILLSTSLTVPNYFSSDYNKAIRIFNETKTGFKQECIATEKYEICASIVFPEFIRYSIFKDFLETEALKSAYVMLGAEIVDFSIGYCQMKPSFVEKLEQYIKNSDILKSRYISIIQYSDTLKKIKRKERVERLENFQWQLKYISCYYDLMEIETRNFQWNSTEDKLTYYSTAYNYSFSKSEKAIKKMQYAKIFPYGNKYAGQQFSYAEVSLYFYKSHLK